MWPQTRSILEGTRRDLEERSMVHVVAWPRCRCSGDGDEERCPGAAARDARRLPRLQTPHVADDCRVHSRPGQARRHRSSLAQWAAPCSCNQAGRPEPQRRRFASSAASVIISSASLLRHSTRPGRNVYHRRTALDCCWRHTHERYDRVRTLPLDRARATPRTGRPGDQNRKSRSRPPARLGRARGRGGV